MKVSFLGLIILASTSVLFAASGHDHEALSAEHTMKQLSYPLNDEKGELLVIVRDDGHLIGKPYVIELRPNCNGRQSKAVELTAKDMESACRVDMESFRFDSERNRLMVKVWDVDTVQYNRASAKSTKSVEPQCSSTAKELAFDLGRLCR